MPVYKDNPSNRKLKRVGEYYSRVQLCESAQMDEEDLELPATPPKKKVHWDKASVDDYRKVINIKPHSNTVVDILPKQQPTVLEYFNVEAKRNEAKDTYSRAKEAEKEAYRHWYYFGKAAARSECVWKADDSKDKRDWNTEAEQILDDDWCDPSVSVIL
jgi:hypothetical protein